MKSPLNALSNLPLVAAGGYELGDVDTRESEPGVMRPRPREVSPVSPVGRRPSITPKPFAPALAPRRGDGHPALVALLVLLLLGGAGYAGWYYFLRPANGAASPRAPAVVPKRPAPDTTKATTTAPPPAPTPPATEPQPAPTVTTVDSPLVLYDRNADSVRKVVDVYDARVFAGQTACPVLSLDLASVEDAWLRYNVHKRRVGTLDGDRFTRDQRLYAAVDSVERNYDRSGCQRP